MRVSSPEEAQACCATISAPKYGRRFGREVPVVERRVQPGRSFDLGLASRIPRLRYDLPIEPVPYTVDPIGLPESTVVNALAEEDCRPWIDSLLNRVNTARQESAIRSAVKAAEANRGKCPFGHATLERATIELIERQVRVRAGDHMNG